MSGEQERFDKPVEYQQVSDEMRRLLDRSYDLTVKDDRRIVVDPIDGYAKQFQPLKPIIIPGMEVTPVDPKVYSDPAVQRRTAAGGMPAGTKSFDHAVGDTDDDGGAEVASDADYEKMFAHRGEFSDSFDFVYGEHGEIIGAMRPEEDAIAEREREANAAKFFDSGIRKLEKKIGSPISQADTSYLHNDETIIQKVKRIVAPPRRRVIHDDDA